MPKWYSRPDGSQWLTEQNAYDFGWINPATVGREWTFPHAVFANAYRCGQTDRQNQKPRNGKYDPAQYDRETFERLPPPVEFD